MRCLEKRPADRWQSAEEFRQQLAPDPLDGGERVRPTPATIAGYLTVTEELCRKLDRASFDPRMIGDRLMYLDNQVKSDVLVLLIDNWAIEGTDPAMTLPGCPYRVVVPTLYGFERDRRSRFPVGVRDHQVLLEALLEHLRSGLGVDVVIAVGFSAAADLVLQMAGAYSPTTRLDGCLALGPNVGIETCTVTGVLSAVTSNAPEILLPALNRALGSVTTVGDWLNLTDDFQAIIRNFGDDFRPIQRFAQDIVAAWQAEGPDLLIRWYRDATANARLLRCVFEDGEIYRTRVRELQLRNLDEGVLGEGYRPGSISVEPVAGLSDLLEPALIRRHLDDMVAALRAGSPGGG